MVYGHALLFLSSVNSLCLKMVNGQQFRVRSILILSFVFAGSTCFQTRFVRVEDDVTTEIIDYVTAQSPLVCAKLCRERPHCDAIDYTYLTQQCGMLANLTSFKLYASGSDWKAGSSTYMYMVSMSMTLSAATTFFHHVGCLTHEYIVSAYLYVFLSV